MDPMVLNLDQKVKKESGAKKVKDVKKRVKTSLILAELCGIAFILVWVTVIMTPFFLALRILGLFRVDELEEEVGMDISHHKGAAYDLTTADDNKVDEFIEKRSFHGGKKPVDPDNGASLEFKTAPDDS